MYINKNYVESNNLNYNNSIEYFKENAKYLIAKNMNGILNELLEDISDFKAQTALKLKSIIALSFTVKACKDKITPSLEKILHVLYNYCDNEDSQITKHCETTSTILGECIKQDIIIPLIIKDLTSIEITGFHQSLYSRLKVLAFAVAKVKDLTVENAELILSAIENLKLFELNDNSNYTNKILETVYYLLHGLIENLNDKLVHFKLKDKLFYLLLILGSIPETQVIHSQILKSLDNLSLFCGFDNLEGLYALELKNILGKFVTNYKDWRRNSPDRFAFDLYVKKANKSLENNWREVLIIIANCTEAERDIEMRIDMVILIEYLLDNSEIKEQIKFYSEFIILEILLPATMWKAQRPNYKVRKAALVCLIRIFKNNLIDVETLNEIFDKILNVLKSSSEDDWDPELRYLSLSALKSVLEFYNTKISLDQLNEVYPVLIKRLDDSQDSNRILVCSLFLIFFNIAKEVRISEGTCDYIVSTSFIHLDDPNENIRNSVLKFMEKASELYGNIVKKIASKNLSTFSNKQTLNKLLTNLN